MNKKAKAVIAGILTCSFLATAGMYNITEAKTSNADLAKGKQLYTTGIQSLGNGDFKSAAQMFMDAEVKDKDNPLYELLAADTLRYLKQYPAAIRYYTEAVEHAGKAKKEVRTKIKSKAYIGLAESYSGNKDDTNAIKYADKAIEEFKTDYRGHYVKGNIFEKNESTQQQAIDEYWAALEIDKTQYNPYVKLIKIYNKQGNTDKVIEVYKQAVDYRPVDENMKMSLAQVYISETKKPGSKKNYYSDAIEVLKSLTNVNKNNAYAHYYLSTIYLLQGEKQKAYEELSVVNTLNLGMEIDAYIKKNGGNITPKTNVTVDNNGGVTISTGGSKKMPSNPDDELITLDDKNKDVKPDDKKASGKEDSFIAKQVSKLESAIKKEIGAN